MSGMESVPKNIQEVLWQTLFSQSPDGIFAIDESQQIIFANDRASSFLGKKQLTKYKMSDLFATESCMDLNNLHKVGVDENVIAQLRTLNGAQKISVISPRNKGITIIRLIDPLNREVNSSKSGFRLINLGRLTADLAHGMSNPLAVIQGRVELLLNRYQNKDPKSERHLNILQSQCKRIGRSLQSIQVMAKSHVPLIQTVAIKGMLDKIVQQGLEKYPNLTVHYDHGIENTLVAIDKNHFIVAFSNLIHKMLEYGDDIQNLSFTLTENKDFHHLRISHDGKGFPASIIDAINNASSLGTIPSSTIGYELAIAFMLLFDMQVKVVVETASAHGFSIVTYLQSIEQRQNLTSTPSKFPKKESLHIMVIDDHNFLRETLTALLSSEGHEITAVSSAEEALLAIYQIDLDIILIDIRLSGMNGEELYNHIKSTDTALSKKVILISGQEYEPPSEVLFLRKPFTKQQLLEAIAALLKGNETD